jgi:UDP-N-acetylmuramoyl-tripeptide--D-alanyl-D-alanine ligase
MECWALDACAKKILSIPRDSEVFLWEMKSSGYGEIREFVRNFPVTQGVITEIPSESRDHESLESALPEVLEIAESVSLVSVYYNNGDEEIARAVETMKSGVRTVKKNGVGFAGDDITISEVRQDTAENGEPSLIVIILTDGGEYRCSAKIFGSQHARSIAFAFCVARELGVAADEICARLESARLPLGMGRVFPTDGGGCVIDETCVSTPDSVSHSIRDVLEFDTRGELPKYAILGGMRGLGEESPYWHGVVMSRASLLDGVYLIGQEWDGVETEQASLRGRWADTDCFIRDFDLSSLNGAVTLVKDSGFYGMGKIISVAPQFQEAEPCS